MGLMWVRSVCVCLLMSLPQTLLTGYLLFGLFTGSGESAEDSGSRSPMFQHEPYELSPKAYSYRASIYSPYSLVRH